MDFDPTAESPTLKSDTDSDKTREMDMLDSDALSGDTGESDSLSSTLESPTIEEQSLDVAKKIVVICHTGHRASLLTLYLRQLG